MEESIAIVDHICGLLENSKVEYNRFGNLRIIVWHKPSAKQAVLKFIGSKITLTDIPEGYAYGEHDERYVLCSYYMCDPEFPNNMISDLDDRYGIHHVCAHP